MRIAHPTFQVIPVEQARQLEPVWAQVLVNGAQATHFPTPQALTSAEPAADGILGLGFSLESCGALFTAIGDHGADAIEVDPSLRATLGEPIAILSVGGAAIDLYRSIRKDDPLAVAVAAADVCTGLVVVLETLAHVIPSEHVSTVVTVVKFAKGALASRDERRASFLRPPGRLGFLPARTC